MKKQNVLFLCTHNSCRSQMAEAWTKKLKNDLIKPYSAGIESSQVDKNIFKVMEEVGIDLTDHYSKTTKDLDNIDFDLVVTVCSNAEEKCPVFPGNVKVIHRGFDDPPALAKNLKDNEEIMNCYRRVRDEIKNFVEQLPEIIKQQH